MINECMSFVTKERQLLLAFCLSQFRLILFQLLISIVEVVCLLLANIDEQEEDARCAEQKNKNEGNELANFS